MGSLPQAGIRTFPRRRAVRALAASAALALGALPAARGQLVFEPPVTSDGGASAVSAIVGDLDEDGLPDAIVNHIFIAAPPALVFGAGDGSFQSVPATLAVGARRLVDFDGDGHLDLLGIPGGTPPLNVTVRPGLGGGSFGPPVGVNSNDFQPVDADVGDFNGDGELDIAILNSAAGAFGGNITVTLGHGDGSFAAPQPVTPKVLVQTSALQNAMLRAGDTNGDGFDDLLCVHGTGSMVLLSQGDGSFAAAPCTGCPVITERDFAFADLNGDGRDDLLTPARSLLGTPDGTLVAAQSFPSGPGALSVATADFDGDGRADVAIGRNASGFFSDPSPVGDVLVLRGLGDGSFATPGLLLSHVTAPAALTAADLDADGRPDLLASCYQPAPASLRAALNHTYGAGSPFLDLGHALAGTHGAPIQLMDGTLVTGQPFAFRLANGPPNGSAYHFVGVGQLNAPFKGGVLVPTPNLINGPLPLDASGGITLAGPWPGGAGGLTLYLQFWMPAAGGPVGLAASSGVRATVP